MKGSECESSRLPVRYLPSISPPPQNLGKTKATWWFEFKGRLGINMLIRLAEALVMSFVDTYCQTRSFYGSATGMD